MLFQLERECSIVFYTKGGMYNCTAVVKKRYRKENLYLLRIVITSGLQKFQRREFFRIPYTTPLKYYEISEQTAQMQTTEELFAEIQKPEYIDQVREGTIQNLHPSQTTAPEFVLRSAFRILRKPVLRPSVRCISFRNSPIRRLRYLRCRPRTF